MQELTVYAIFALPFAAVLGAWLAMSQDARRVAASALRLTWRGIGHVWHWASAQPSCACPQNGSHLPDAGEKVAVICIAALALVVFSVHIVQLWPVRIDDGYITMCYSYNLAHGHGPIYSQGIERSEGCTSMIWVWLMAIPMLLHADPWVFAKIIGIAFTIGALWLVGLTIYRQTGNVLAAVIPPSVLALTPQIAIHAQSDMETSALMFAIAAVVYGAAIRAKWLSVAALLLGLTHPEGLLLGVAAMAYITATERPIGPALLRATLGFVLPGVAYFAWRASYYGLPLPLPFYMKAGAAHGWPGLTEVQAFAAMYCPVLAAAIVGCGVDRRNVAPVLVSVATIAYFAHIIPMMGFAHRFEFPYLLSLLPACGSALSWVARLRFPGVRVLQIATAYTVATVAIALGGYTGDTATLAKCGADVVKCHYAVGKILAETAHGGTVACGDAGMLAFNAEQNGWHAVDIFGLNERTIALHPKLAAEVTESYSPDVLVLRTRKADATSDVDSCDWRVMRASQGHFDLASVVCLYKNAYYLQIYTARNAIGRAVRLRFMAPKLVADQN